MSEESAPGNPPSWPLVYRTASSIDLSSIDLS